MGSDHSFFQSQPPTLSFTPQPVCATAPPSPCPPPPPASPAGCLGPYTLPPPPPPASLRVGWILEPLSGTYKVKIPSLSYPFSYATFEYPFTGVRGWGHRVEVQVWGEGWGRGYRGEGQAGEGKGMCGGWAHAIISLPHRSHLSLTSLSFIHISHPGTSVMLPLYPETNYRCSAHAGLGGRGGRL